MIVRTFFRQREDGTNLYRTYSDKNMMIRQIETDTLYSEAVDVENAPYSYEETEIATDENWKEITEEQERKMREEDTLMQEQQITDTAVNTLNSPINYIPPMEIFKGNYYIQDNITYECIRNSEKQLDNNLCDLIGLYVYKV